MNSIKALKALERISIFNQDVNGQDHHNIFHAIRRGECHARVMQKEQEKGNNARYIEKVMKTCLTPGDYRKYKKFERKSIDELGIKTLGFGDSKRLAGVR